MSKSLSCKHLNHKQRWVGEKDNAQLRHNPHNIRLAVKFRKPTDWKNLVERHWCYCKELVFPTFRVGSSVKYVNDIILLVLWVCLHRTPEGKKIPPWKCEMKSLQRANLWNLWTWCGKENAAPPAPQIHGWSWTHFTQHMFLALQSMKIIQNLETEGEWADNQT